MQIADSVQLFGMPRRSARIVETGIYATAESGAPGIQKAKDHHGKVRG